MSGYADLEATDPSAQPLEGGVGDGGDGGGGDGGGGGGGGGGGRQSHVQVCVDRFRRGPQWYLSTKVRERLPGGEVAVVTTSPAFGQRLSAAGLGLAAFLLTFLVLGAEAKSGGLIVGALAAHWAAKAALLLFVVPGGLPIVSPCVRVAFVLVPLSDFVLLASCNLKLATFLVLFRDDGSTYWWAKSLDFGNDAKDIHDAVDSYTADLAFIKRKLVNQGSPVDLAGVESGLRNLFGDRDNIDLA